MAASVVRAGGFAIGSILLLALVVTLVCLSLGALCSFELLFAEESANSRDAVLLAESAINEVVSKLSTTNGGFGTASQALSYQPSASDLSRFATVTFDRTSPLPYSTNNLGAVTGTVVLGFGGVPVPPHSARLIATGRSHGRVVHVEVQIQPYQFPYPLACGGSLSVDTLTVFGAGSLAEFVTTSGAPKFDSTASVAYLGPTPFSPLTPVNISGDLYYLSSTSVSLPPTSTVRRTVRPVSNLQLPDIDIVTLFTRAATAISAIPTVPSVYSGGPACGPGYFVAGTDPSPATVTITSAVLDLNGSGLTVTAGNLALADAVLYVRGPLTVAAGDLVLNHSIVYVTGGAVSIAGTIHGSGAVITDGNVTFRALSATEHDTEVGVVSGGRVTLNPGTSSPGFFQGLLYAAGSLTINGSAANPILAGGVFVSLGDVTLSHTTVESIPECSSLRFATWQPGPNPPAFGSITLLTGGAFKVQDVQASVATTCLTPTEVSAVYNAVSTLAAVPAYAAQMVAGLDPLQIASFAPAWRMSYGEMSFDPCINRFSNGFPGGCRFFNGASGVTQSVFDGVATSQGTTTEDLKLAYFTADELAVAVANQQLSADEAAALTSGSGGLPSAPSAERVTLDLAQWLKATSGQPSYAIASWRTF